MNRRFRAGEMSLKEVADNLAPLAAVTKLPGSSSLGQESVGASSLDLASAGSTTSGDRDSRPTPPAFRKEERDSITSGGIELQRAAHDAIHSYLSHIAGYDMDLATPAYYKVASTLEAIAQPLSRKAQAQQDSAR